ncbi:MAG: substrate-binding domain-containing protein, partial [Brevinematia bacterium]
LENIPTILIDNNNGMQKVIDHLIEFHGYENIVFITGPFTSIEAIDRFNGYKESLRKHQIKYRPEFVIEGDFTYDFGWKVPQILLDDRKLNFDAIVCSNDEMAMGVFHSMEARGMIAPKDYALTGFDNVRETEFFSVPITTVSQPIYEQGRKAVEILIDILDGKEVANTTYLDTELVIRTSCGCYSYIEKDNDDNLLSLYNYGEGSKKNPLLKDSRMITEDIINYLSNDRAINLEEMRVHLNALLDSLNTDLSENKKGKKTIFTLVLDDILAKDFRNYDQLIFWKEAILKLHKMLINNTMPPELIIKIGRIFEEANNLINTYLIRSEASKNEKFQKFFWYLRMFIASLDDEFNIYEISNILYEKLQSYFKIKAAFIFLFKQEEKDFGPLPLQVSTLLAYDERGRIDNGHGDIVFFTRQILPTSFILESKRYSLLFFILFTKRGNYGYIAYEPSDTTPLFLYPLLTERISGTIQKAYIFNEKERVSLELQETLSKLSKSEENYKEMTEMLPLGIIETDLNHNIFYMNNMAKSLLQIDNDIKDLNFMNFMVEKDKFIEYCRYITKTLRSSFSDFTINTSRNLNITLICKSVLVTHENYITGYRWIIIELSSFLKSSLYPTDDFYRKFSITQREREVLECLLQGMALKDIANKLYITPGTVKDHLSSIYKKTNTKNKKELLAKIREHGFMKLDDSSPLFSI